MKNFYLIAFSCLIIITLSGCSKNTAELNECIKACSEIIPSNTAPQIEQVELEAGMYFGFINQKKKGTPSDWVHILGETKSSQWRSVEKAKNYDCDCNK